MTERPGKITEKDIAKLAASVEAPASLHRRVQEMVAQAQGGAAKRRRLGLSLPAVPLRRLGGVAAAGALAAAVAVVLAATLSGGGAALTPQAAAALALAPATLPAPRESTGNRGELAAAVEGLPFPYWNERFGWRGSGARADVLAGHSVTTVFYSDGHGRRIGYAIASGAAPARLAGAAIRRWGVTYWLSRQDGANVIAWRRAGHLCVIAARGVGSSTLVSLASWEGSQPA